ncbi:hypothetical protein SNE40_013521 [Patella caerulea]|uniref:Uncharacterized protein n=1 Tax=Patella caerulea TaxID=87958 RepID=A0AAN8PB06_PATCE
MKNIAVVTVFVFTWLYLAVVTGQGVNNDFTRMLRNGRVSRQAVICSRNMACQWAICPWRKNVIVTRNECNYIPNMHCSCASGTSCRPSGSMETHRKSLVTYGFTCQ